MNDVIYLQRGLIPTVMGSQMLSTIVSGPFGATLLLSGETDGFSIDATSYDTVTVASYIGGPVGGTVSVETASVFSSNNVALDNSNLTQSGTSAKTVHFPSSPYVRWTPHNILSINSENYTSSWSVDGGSVTGDTAVAPNGATTADTFTESGANSRHMVYTAFTSVVGFVYTFSVYVKKKDHRYVFLSLDGTGWYAVAFDLDTGLFADDDISATTQTGYAISVVGGGWYRISVSRAATDTTTFPEMGHADAASPTWSTGYPSYTGDGTTGTYFWGAQVNRGPIATPYLVTTSAARIGIPQGYDIAASKYGVLIEPAATNLVLHSEELDVGSPTWSRTGATTATNDTTAPDGSSTAERFNVSTGNTAHFMYSNATTTVSNSTYTLSVYVKALSGQQYVQLFAASFATAARYYAAVFDIVNGTVTNTGNSATGATYISSSVTSIGNGWFRLTVTGSMTPTDPVLDIEASNSATPTRDANGDITWNAVGNETFYVWGAQLELGTVATSYIPTVAATATRAVDTISAAVSTIPYSQTLGTVYCDYKNNDTSLFGFLWEFYEATDDYITHFDNATDPIFEVSEAGPSVQAHIDTGTVTQGARSQVSEAWKANDFAASKDGAAVGTDVSGTVTGAVSTLYIGIRASGTTPLNAFVNRLVYVPRRVIDGDLPTWRYS